MCAKVDAVTPGCPSTILTHDAAVGGRVGAQNVLGVLQQAAHATPAEELFSNDKYLQAFFQHITRNQLGKTIVPEVITSLTLPTNRFRARRAPDEQI